MPSAGHGEAQPLTPDRLRRVAVIGAGAIGCATAGWLARRGLEVAVHDVDPTPVNALAERAEVRLLGALDFTAPIALASTDLAEVLAGAQLVITAVPASVHEILAKAAAPHLEPGSVLLIQPGQTLSSVAFLHAARQAGMAHTPIVVETLSALFAAKLTAPGEVTVHGVKRFVPYAVLPATELGSVGPWLEPLSEAFTPWSSILQLGLHNVNAVLHPPITLLNAGPIDSARPFNFYRDGGTPAVLRLAEAIDRERIALVEALGLDAMSIVEWLDAAYGYGRDTVYETVRDTVPYQNLPAPDTLQTRLLLEDIPTGLVPICAVAELAGVPTPTMHAITHTCGHLYDIDFMATGRNLQNLGLAELDRATLLTTLGPAPAL